MIKAYFLDDGADLSQMSLEEDALIFIGKSKHRTTNKIFKIQNNKLTQLNISAQLLSEINDIWAQHGTGEYRDQKKWFDPGTHELLMIDKVVKRTVELIASQLDFPYTRSDIMLLKDGIRFFTLGDLKGEFHPTLVANAGSIKSGFEALAFIRTNHKKLLSEGGIRRDCFQTGTECVEKGEALSRILRSIEPSFQKFWLGCEHIVGRFTSSNPKLTEKKTEILDNFLEYCLNNWKEDTIKNKKDLVENWAGAYKLNNQDQNPFTILAQQRRTTGFFSLFNPKLTDSIKLFKEFLGEEKLPPLLQDAIKELDTPSVKPK